MKLAAEIIIILFGTLNLILTRFALMRLHQPTTLPVWGIKVFASALSPVLFLVGLVTIISGMFLDSIAAITIGTIGTVSYLIHMIKITRGADSSTGFESAFGKNWKNNIPDEKKSFFLPNRYVLWFPKTPEPVLVQNISFHTIQNSNRQLLCDLWVPPANTKRSGLAFIYLHGSAWTFLDKDYGTRIFFQAPGFARTCNYGRSVPAFSRNRFHGNGT
jgi:hypothetical protein